MKFFKKSAFACKCCGVSIVDVELADVLDSARAHFNAPISIISGYRCPVHNSKVGGAKNSQHMQGIAADIKVSCKTPKEVYDYFESKFPNTYGLGLYKSWVHIDVRQNKARWNG